LGPVGYWPADAREGVVLRDLSPTGNDGEIVHVPWEAGADLLDFTGAFQWLEIPANAAYQTERFSLGGWVWMRSPVIGSGWPNRQGFLFLGNDDWLNQVGVQLCIRRQELIDVVSDGREDVLGTRQWVGDVDGVRIREGRGEPSLPLKEWHHLIYTFEPHADQPGLPEAPNLALEATVTVSNDGGHAIRAPANAFDGDPETHWVLWPGAGPQPDHEKWIQIDFAEPTTLNRIRLLGRTGRTDYFAEGKLRFSDGSEIAVPSLVDGWDALFPDKTVEWVRFEAGRVVGPRPGLAEIGLYKDPQTVYQEEGIIENSVVGSGVLGTGTLYWNGKPIASSEEVLYRRAKDPLRVGNDAYWWHQQGGKSGALDGSVRDLVWFDRALSAEEVGTLHEATVPQVTPRSFGEDDLVVGSFAYGEYAMGGREVSWEEVSDLPANERRRLLEDLASRDAAFKERHLAEIEGLLGEALGNPETRLAAVRLALSLPDAASREAWTQRAVEACGTAVGDESLDRDARAEAALGLAEAGKSAEPSLPVVEGTLAQLLAEEGAAFPVVEDHFRNALIRALLEIHPEGPEVGSLLLRSLVDPAFTLVDFPAGPSRPVRNLLEAGQVQTGLDLLRKLTTSLSPDFFTRHDTGPAGNYTGTAEYQGYTYKVGTGEAWQGVEAIAPEDYEKVVARWAGTVPSAAAWRSPDFPHLYRVPITKTGPDGETQKIYLEGPDFVLDGHDAKVRGWSIFIDELGYVHLMGGQHNMPNPDYFIPGSWERMGLSSDRSSEDFPAQMYWVSSEPGSIDSFEFVGSRSDPRRVPANYLNYLVFLQSPERETFLYGRASGSGFQSWGMFRYGANDQRWVPVGDDPFVVAEDLRETNPDWLELCRDPIRGGIPKAPTGENVLVWAWQPGFYNFCRDNWGARFDPTGRIHVHMQINGLNEEGHNRFSGVYAYSDDLGRTFHRADGTPVELPLTINPAPGHGADLADGDTRQWWTLWVGLIEELGFKVVRPSAL
jgi:hypothetical protein